MPAQGRLGDRAQSPADAHGCPACPHPVLGPAIAGSPTVFVNNLPALRKEDPGIHAPCCGENRWNAAAGAPSVFINGKPAYRKFDASQHCGGIGRLIEGSPNVNVGSDAGGGAGGSPRAAGPDGGRTTSSNKSGGTDGGSDGGGPDGGGTDGDKTHGDKPDGDKPDDDKPKKIGHVLELEDAFFRTDSAVFLPDGQTPTQQTSSHQVTGASLIATLLRDADEKPERSVLVVGHTDTTGSVDYDQKLSQRRADAVRSVALGDRDRFAALSVEHHLVADYQQILQWVATAQGWPCDPGGVDNQPGPRTTAAVRSFQSSWNTEGKAGNASAPDLAVTGVMDRSTWAAFHDCYQDAIADELGAQVDGLAAFRAKIKWLAQGSVGCGKAHPIEAAGVDNYRSQTNRRVEVIAFDPGNEPDLPCHGGGGCNPGACDLYDPDKFTLLADDPMMSAKPWTAKWPDELAAITDDTIAELALDAPGLPAGTSVTFEITEVGRGVVATREVEAAQDGAILDFGDWFDPERELAPVALGPGQRFPTAKFSFRATANGRSEDAPAKDYADAIAGVVLDDLETPMPNTAYIVVTAWGTRTGTTDAEGKVDESGLPPGGAVLVVDGVARRTST